MNTRCGLCARISPIAGLPWLEQRAARMGAQPVASTPIGSADAAIDLQHAEPEIEQHRAAVLRPQRLVVRPSSVRPCAGSSRLRLAAGRTRRAGSRPCVLIVSNATGRKSGCASSRMPPRGVTTDTTFRYAECRPAHRLAHELRDRAERAEAPLRCGSASCSVIKSNALAISSPRR